MDRTRMPRSCLEMISTTRSLGSDSKRRSPFCTRSFSPTGWISTISPSSPLFASMSKFRNRTLKVCSSSKVRGESCEGLSESVCSLGCVAPKVCQSGLEFLGRRILSKQLVGSPRDESTSTAGLPRKAESSAKSSAVTRLSPCSRTSRKRPPLLLGSTIGANRISSNRLKAPMGRLRMAGSKKLKGLIPSFSSRPLISRLVLVPMVVSMPPMIDA
mmetsp:Transcript_97731/g.232730  ORF Transcript_97731/g.232730 Transcript_97731/m.232730 type:complete len:215 (-) Transcript_97731:509-1153(-)